MRKERNTLHNRILIGLFTIVTIAGSYVSNFADQNANWQPSFWLWYLTSILVLLVYCGVKKLCGPS